MMPNKHNTAPAFAPQDFQKALLAWYGATRRDLPWRAKAGEKSDPYRVWLSEIMLQQTTVKAVIPYFEGFVARWPTVQALGAASRDEVMAAWAGLGYYSRARNLYACAQTAAAGGFPADEAALRRLPGIGAYTAAAIAAIAFNIPAAAVDGNVERVLARLYSLGSPLPSGRARIRALAATLVSPERPGDYAQAMMDLGATICRPRAPSCDGCPVRCFCSAAAAGEPERYPIKLPKAARPLRCGDAFVAVRHLGDGLHVLLRRRPENGLLGGMMEVPGSDWVAAGSAKAVGIVPAYWRQAQTVQHTFTHFHLELRVFAALGGAALEGTKAFEGEWAPLDELARFALPAVMKKAVAAGLEALGIGAAEKAAISSTRDARQGRE